MSDTLNQSEIRAVRLPGRYSRWPDVALIIILALLPCLFFWRLITPNPADRMHIAAGDFTEQYFPLRAFAAQEWVHGRVPLWNPYLYGGQPALADIQSGALYPVHVIEALILGWGGPLFGQEIGFPLWALELQVIAHFSLASVGSYLFARHLGQQSGVSWRRARFGGVIAALVFTYGGYLTGFPVQQVTILEVSAWLPWVMWAVSVGSRQIAQWQIGNQHRLISWLKTGAWGGLAFALAILAGHPQTVLYIFYLTLAYTLFQAFYTWQRESTSQRVVNHQTSHVSMDEGASAPLPLRSPALAAFPFRLLRLITLHLLLWLVIILLGLSIAAAQILPTVEFIAHSLRADLAYQTVSTGLPLNELVSILYPGFFGGSPEYVGIVTLVLVGLALPLGHPRRDVFFWAGAGLVSLILAFGGNTFLYPFFYLLVPGFETVRQQERAFLIYSFSLAVLAGYGATVLAGPLSKLARPRYALFESYLRVVSVVALGLTGFFIYGSATATARGDEVNLFFGVLRHHLFGLMMLAGVWVLLILRPRRWLRRSGGMSLVALWLAFNLFTVNWRFNLEKRSPFEPFLPSRVVQFLQAWSTDLPSSPPGRVVSGGRFPGGNSAAAVYNLQDLTGNTPLQLARVDTFFQRMPAWRMWQLMNVRYVVDDRDISSNGLSLVFEEGALKVFEVQDPFPRAWFVSQTEVIPEDDRAMARLANDNFDLRQTAVLAKPLPAGISLVEPSTSSITIVDFRPTYLKAEVEASGTHLLVLSQIYYPGWQAEVDGQPTELRRVNVIQQGLILTAGRHVVQLSFKPGSFWWGGMVSIVAVFVWLVIIVSGNPVSYARK